MSLTVYYIKNDITSTVTFVAYVDHTSGYPTLKASVHSEDNSCYSRIEKLNILSFNINYGGIKFVEVNEELTINDLLAHLNKIIHDRCKRVGFHSTWDYTYEVLLDHYSHNSFKRDVGYFKQVML